MGGRIWCTREKVGWRPDLPDSPAAACIPMVSRVAGMYIPPFRQNPCLLLPISALLILCLISLLAAGCIQPHDKNPLPPAPLVSKSNGSALLSVSVTPASGINPSAFGQVPSIVDLNGSTPCIISGNTSVGSLSGSGCFTLMFIDVEQGDAILIQSPSGRTMLIDAGKEEHGDDVVSALRQHGITSIDILVATHPHGDHIGGMPAVIAAFPVREFVKSVTPCDSSACRVLKAALAGKDIPAQVVSKGDIIPFDLAVNITVLNPPQKMYNEVNDNSLVLRLAYGNTTFLLTGDAGKEAEAGMIASGEPLKADLLKAGHHGLSSSTTGPFVSRVDPEVAVISLEKSTRPTHPDPAVIRRLAEGGSVVYRTDNDGTITLASNGSALAVITGKNQTPAWYPAHTVA